MRPRKVIGGRANGRGSPGDGRGAPSDATSTEPFAARAWRRAWPALDGAAAAARLGITGTVVLVAIALIAINSTQLAALFGQRRFTAQFTEAGGIAVGGDVVMSGVIIGKVRDVRLAGDHVDVGFTVSDSSARIGDTSSAAIKSKIALGKKVLSITSVGAAPMRSGATIPTSRTTPAYDVTEALADLTRTVTAIDTPRLAQSLDAVSAVLDAAAPKVRPLLDGTTRLSQLIGDRDAQLNDLVAHSANVTGVLAARDEQIRTLIQDGNLLLAELNRRGGEISALLDHTIDLSRQLDGLVTDNQRQAGPTLDKLNRLLATLRAHKRDIDDVLNSIGPPLRELTDAAAGSPGFNVSSPNLFTPFDLVPVPPLPSLLPGGTR
jgi:phospholipid/cholesterol/gamma-HCH transport system substrate-binding protein